MQLATFAYLSFAQLQGTLVLADLQKLSDSPLIWGKTSYIPDYFPNKSCSLATPLQVELAI